MSQLNPITAVYLKLLEFVSLILIGVGEKLDPLFSLQQPSSDQPHHLYPPDFRCPHDEQCFEYSLRSSSSDSEEPMRPNTPDYYFDQYDLRSPFYDHFHDSDAWDNTFTGPDNHHGPDPFDSY